MRVLLLVCLTLLAVVSAALAGDARVALVVGVASYQHAAALANTRNDASDVGAALQRLGFTVQTVLDPDRAAFERAVRQFGESARGAEAAVFFYAGHAMEVGGRNWLLPTSVELKTPRDLRFEAVDVESLLEQTDGSARVTLLFLDACRDNPFQKRLATGSRDIPRGGLGQVSAGAGTLVAFATAPGTVARDGKGRNSPFTTALLRHIETPGLEVRQLLGLVRRDVREASNGAQLPWENAALEGEFYFKARQPQPQPQPQPQTQPQTLRIGEQAQRDTTVEAELLFWQSVKDSRDPLDFQAYLARFPNGVFADLARRRAVAATPAAPPVAPLSAVPPIPPAIAPAVPARSFEARLVEALDRTGDPTKAPWLRDEHRRTAEQYLTVKSPKALAVDPRSGRTFWQNAAASVAEAERRALEGCQQGSGGPCILVAADEALRSSEPRPVPSTVVLQAAPTPGFENRLVEALDRVGDFVAAPWLRDGHRSAAQRYMQVRSPKAMAVEPRSGRTLWWSTVTSSAAAEQLVLEGCQQSYVEPCVLVAANEELVAPNPRDAPLRRMERLSYAGRFQIDRVPLSDPIRPHDVVRAYGGMREPKALVVRPQAGVIVARSGASVAEAEAQALAACNANPSPSPCFLYAVNDQVVLPQRRTEARR